MADSSATTALRAELKRALDKIHLCDDKRRELVKESLELESKLVRIRSELKAAVHTHRKADQVAGQIQRRLYRALDRDTRAEMRKGPEWVETSENVWEGYGYREASPYVIRQTPQQDGWVVSLGGKEFRRFPRNGLKQAKNWSLTRARNMARGFIDDLISKPHKSSTRKK